MSSNSNIYIGGVHALAFYLSPKVRLLDEDFENSLSSARKTNFLAHYDGSIDFGELTSIPVEHVPCITRSKAYELRRYLGPDLPLNVVVPIRESRRNSKCMACSVLSPSVSINQFLQVDANVFIATPELAATQVACGYDIVELTVLLSLLCGAFIMDKAAPEGFVPRRPVTTLQRIASFLAMVQESGSEIAGTRQMGKALQYTAAGSASPAEVNIGLRMSLPRSLSGYGFSGMTRNEGMNVNIGLGGPKMRYPDFLWREKRVGAEFQSDMDHADPARVKADRERLNQLSAAGITMFELSSSHLMNVRKMDEAADELAVALKTKRVDMSQPAVREREELRRTISLALDHFGYLWV